LKNVNHKLIFDTSVVTELIRAGLLDSLLIYRDIAKVEMILPVDVRAELEREDVSWKFRDTLKSFIERRLFRILNPAEDTVTELKHRYHSLGDGEIGVLATALTLRKHSSTSVIAVLDDAQARNTAKKLGLKVHGTLWILVQLKKHQAINREVAIKAIKELPNRGFYIVNEKLWEIIKEVEKDC
jgi:predicted nucleic acid-binding protein